MANRPAGLAGTERDATLTTATRINGAATQRPHTSHTADAGVEAILQKILSTLDDSKAEDIVSIPLFDRTDLADYMVIASGRSQRHVDAIATHVLNALAKMGKHDVRIEGRPHCDWVLIDQGDVILHLFHPEVRNFYNLEKLWSDDRPSERTVA